MASEFQRAEAYRTRKGGGRAEYRESQTGHEQDDLRIFSVLFSADILISPVVGSQPPHEPKETYLLIPITSPTVEQGLCVIGGNSKGLSHLSLGVKIPGPPFCWTVCLGLAAIGRANPLRTWCKEGATNSSPGTELGSMASNKVKPKDYRIPAAPRPNPYTPGEVASPILAFQKLGDCCFVL